MATKSACSALILFFMLIPPPSGPRAATFVEDFSSTVYCDQSATTAWWDIAAGEIRLFPFELSSTGSYDTPGSARDLVVAGDHVFIADDGSGLQIIDITDPANPGYLGSFDTSGRAFGVAVSGDHAYVADYGSGLVVVDISDPTNPVYAGGWDTPGDMYMDLAVEGDYAYMADRSSGLQIMDISDPANPVPAGNYNTPGWAYDVVVAGDCAFVADLTAGLRVVDISDPANPVSRGSLFTSGAARSLAVAGDYAFMAASSYGLQVVDISDPDNPVVAGGCGIVGDAQAVAVAGDYLYVAAYGGGVSVFDITDPADPGFLYSFTTPGLALDVAVAGEQAYVADADVGGLRVVRVAGRVDSPRCVNDYTGPGFSHESAIDGDHIFGAASEAVLAIDISDPRSPELVGFHSTCNPNDVVVRGDHAYLASGLDGLLVLDISDPASPAYLGKLETPGSGTAITVAGDYAYIADGEGYGVEVIDITDPANPIHAGSYFEPGCWPRDIAVAGNRAYVADSYAGLKVLDISDPTTPVLLGSCATPGGPLRLSVAGDFAYVADFMGLQLIDIGDPANPVLLGSYDPPDMLVYSFRIAGDVAFVGVGGPALHMVDISDAANPVLAGVYDSIGLNMISPHAVAGDYLYAFSNIRAEVVEVFWRRFDPNRNVAQSLSVDESEDTISRVRLAAVQIDSVRWDVSADGGINWQALAPDYTWRKVSVAGSDLRWRSTHIRVLDDVNPGCSELTIEWLVDGPAIEGVVDIPADQGGRVRVDFSRSGRDFSDEVDFPVDDYCLWRRVEDPALLESVGHLRDIPSSTTGSEAFDASLVVRGDRSFVIGGPSEAGGQFPPGLWEAMGGFSATQQDRYIFPAETLADSSAGGIRWSVFCVTAHTTTPSIWYCSRPDSGWSVDNLAPSVPEDLMVAYADDGNELDWVESGDADFRYFKIYRGSTPDFVVDPENPEHVTTAAAWTDPVGGFKVHYKVSAVDFAGNESAPASPVVLTGVEAPSLRFALLGNAPNPFNPKTTIVFTLPQAADVSLVVYDLSGRLVATLLDGAPHEQGRHEAVWDGLDAQGRTAAAGAYIYRIRAGAWSRTRRMMLVK